MRVILDYGMGNTGSVEKAVKSAGFDVVISRDTVQLEKASTIIVPGVGTYNDAMQKLASLNLIDVLRDLILVQKKQYLGFCLGMQILSEFGYEGKKTNGLNFIPGEVIKIPSKGQKLPHMGWNDVNPTFKNALGDLTDKNFYFMHSYYFSTDKDYISSTTFHGLEITSSIQYKNIFGAQFHPEKSQYNGLIYLQNILKQAQK